jgi:hypothetical protein
MAKRRKKARRPKPAPQPTAEEAEAPEAPAPVKARRRLPDERPEAPWGNFPLIELSVLAGLIMLILGFFVVEGDRAPILIVAGLALGSIGGLDQAIREHFAGYASHTALLAGVPALAVLAALFYGGPDSLPPLARAGIAIAVFAIAAWLLSREFSRRSGGQRFKVRPIRPK